jgi:DNA repair and recombination protein RAD52
MTLSPEQVQALDAPLNKANVKKNPRGFDYVEAWHAISEANRIFGFDGWVRETVLMQETNRDLVELQGSSGPYKHWRVGYLAKVRITAGGVVREGTGFGSGMSKPDALGDAIESAAKEAESDAMKRALMTFGNPFGLALYDKAQTCVVTDPPLPKASELAITLLRGCAGDQALFKEAWEKNKDGWKGVMHEAEYRAVVAVMKEIAATFAQPQQVAA